jgi:hypothetical protein
MEDAAAVVCSAGRLSAAAAAVDSSALGAAASDDFESFLAFFPVFFVPIARTAPATGWESTCGYVYGGASWFVFCDRRGGGRQQLPAGSPGCPVAATTAAERPAPAAAPAVSVSAAIVRSYPVLVQLYSRTSLVPYLTNKSGVWGAWGRRYKKRADEGLSTGSENRRCVGM